MKFIVKEKEWLRGQGSLSSKLLKISNDGDEKKCCLGFVALQSGIDKTCINEVPSPYETRGTAINKWPSWIFSNAPINYGLSLDGKEIVYLNDKKDISDYKRKKEIRKIFKRNGDAIVFTKK